MDALLGRMERSEFVNRKGVKVRLGEVLSCHAKFHRWVA